MEVVQVFHVNKGDGETSYAKNSTLQSKIISKGKPVIEEALLGILSENIPESIGIADLGCSSGPNSLVVVSEILDIIHAICRNLGRPPSPEFRVSLNDLPGNDFNSIFESLPAFFRKQKQEKGAGFGRCFISGVAGSFYDRLFPDKSLHFVHSSSSLHWLSQVPPILESDAKALNKGKIYISRSSPQCVLDAYLVQFQNDFSQFLKSRAEEMVSGGRMVLSLVGRRFIDPTTEESHYPWKLLAHALISMVAEGTIEEEKVDSFNLPFYAPCPEELEMEIQKEGSFTIDRLEAFEIEWDGGVEEDMNTRGERVAKTIRAVVESMLENHFGNNMMDDLFKRYAKMVDDYYSSKTETKFFNLVISIIKHGN